MSEQDILTSLAALRDGLIKRVDEQGAKLDSLGAAVEQDFDTMQATFTALSDVGKLETALKGLGQRLLEHDKLWARVDGRLDIEARLLAGLESKLGSELYEHLAASESRIINRINMIAGELAAAPKQKQRMKMGSGNYSCASCGLGMKKPCKHWKKLQRKGRRK